MTQRLVFAVCLIVLAGCATHNWYLPSTNGQKANLRVIAIAPGNTYLISTPAMLCPPSAFGRTVGVEDRVLGFFNQGGSGDYQASHRGFDRRVKMPRDERYPKHLYAEHSVDAERAIIVRASNIYGRGGPGNIGHCHALGKALLKAGRDYEILFEGAGEKCQMSLYELVIGDNQQVSSVKRAFDEGPRNCQFGN